MDVEILRYLDQSEMECCINENSTEPCEKKLPGKNGFSIAVIIFGILVSSMGLFKYISSNSEGDKTINQHQSLPQFK
jgi:hypothetical protein